MLAPAFAHDAKLVTEALLDEGKRLMSEEGTPAGYRLVPGLGARLNLGVCHEKGRPIHKEVASAAGRTQCSERAFFPAVISSGGVTRRGR
jgi:hypothetical protein